MNLKQKLSKIFSLILSLGLISSLLYGCTASQNKILDTQNNQNSEAIELQYTKEEQKEMGKWKNKSPNALLDDALDGDAAALYMMGACYMYGQMDLPIDLETADKYFSASASLGFPPAIDQIHKKYLEENKRYYQKLCFKS